MQPPERPVIQPISSAFHGYLSADLTPPPGYGFGVSFYVTVWALLNDPVQDFTVGLPSTWIQPNNKDDFKYPLCPVGTGSRDDADKQEAENPTADPNLPHDWIDQAKDRFRAVFQNIEGGLGIWGSTRFPTNAPKYRILGIPDCYSTAISSPGWPFGEFEVLKDKDMGLAQLSNSILIPPDGITFAAGSETKRVGLAWMALPLTDHDGYFLLKSKESFDPQKPDKQTLCVQRASTGGVLKPVDEKPGPNDNQLWTLVPSNQKGYFVLKTKGNDTPADFGDGTAWKLVPAVEDYYYLETSKGKRLDGSGTVKAGSSSKSDAQIWKLVPQAINHNPPCTDDKDIDPDKVDVATGDLSWTLFLNTERFKGPVAFFPPKTWSRISKRNPKAVGRGLDVRMAIMASPAMEFNTVPGLRVDYEGSTYLRIPRLFFPTETQGGKLVTPLMQDVTLYSREAIYAPMMSAFAKGSAPSSEFQARGAKASAFKSAGSVEFDSPKGFIEIKEGLKLTGISELVEVTDLGKGKSCSWGLLWKDARTGFPKGKFPEYFINGTATPMVPDQTFLAAAQFAPAEITTRNYYNSPLTKSKDEQGVNAWTKPGLTRGAFPENQAPVQIVILGDGSRVWFTWYKFIDQPALQNLNLTDEQKNQLQSRVELLHREWNIKKTFMKNPSVGKLALVDPALIVTPPKGFERGFVPIVTTQMHP
jgi:hypothetical protein